MSIDWRAKAEMIVTVSSEQWFEDHRGPANWDDVGSPICVAYGNDGYAEDKRSQVEVGVLRKYLEANGITELAFATNKEGYSWAMIIGAGHSELMRDVLRKAWNLASKSLGHEGDDREVSEVIDEVWERLSEELALKGVVELG